MTSPSKSLDDIRSVGITNVPIGSFLITGRPRVRSAWLAALLSFGDKTIYHEAPLASHPIVTDKPFGLIDPGAATLYPHLALSKFLCHRIVIIERSEKDSRAALERLVGQKIPHWNAIESRYRFFKKECAPHIVHVESLNDYDAMNSLTKYCIGQPLPRWRFDLFDGLRVDQDYKKAQAREAAA